MNERLSVEDLKEILEVPEEEALWFEMVDSYVVVHKRFETVWYDNVVWQQKLKEFLNKKEKHLTLSKFREDLEAFKNG